MMKSKWCLVLGILGICLFVTAASARDLEAKIKIDVPEGTQFGGRISSQAGLVATGDVVYSGGTLGTGFFPQDYSFGYPGGSTVSFDDIWIEPGPNDVMVGYSVGVYGRADFGEMQPMTTYTTALWYDTEDPPDPNIGLPDTMIPGTECVFVDVPAGLFQLDCYPTDPNITLPRSFWMSLHSTSDSYGWLNAAPVDCPTTGPPGYSEEFWCQYLGPGNSILFGCYYFSCAAGSGCADGCSQASFALNPVISLGSPWACCDMTTFDCDNVQETDCAGVFTEGTLCNNLEQPCSEAGACCDTTTGVCEDTFALYCDGFLQMFYPGELCADVDCPVPPNVPTLTQWGMIALTVLLLTGLTIRFGRRRTVTA